MSDVQVGAKGVDLAGFIEYIKEATADPIGRLLGLGDYTDGVSPSNRKLLRSAFVKGELYDTVQDMLDESAGDQVGEFLAAIIGTVNRWDVVTSGHHFHHFERDNQNGDSAIAKMVNAPYVEDGQAVVIRYVFPATKKWPEANLDVWLRHGEGSGESFAAPLNQLEKQMRAFTAHIYLLAHHHKLVAARAVKLQESPSAETSLVATDSLLVCTGSWLRGYMPNESTYAERDMLVPLATGAPIVKINRREDGRLRIRCEI